MSRTPDRDPGLDALLGLDGELFVIDPAGKHWVKFEVKQVAVTPERPHGLRYSLTLHDESGARLIGYDNAHPVTPRFGPSARAGPSFDHLHRTRTIRAYDYRDAASLLEDFWKDVEAALDARGVKR